MASARNSISTGLTATAATISHDCVAPVGRLSIVGYPLAPADRLSPRRSTTRHPCSAALPPARPASPCTSQDGARGTQSSQRGGVALFGQTETAPPAPPPEPSRQAPCSAPDLAATDPCLSPASSRSGRSGLLKTLEAARPLGGRRSRRPMRTSLPLSAVLRCEHLAGGRGVPSAG